ncbi:MAG: type II restriction endonuclease [Chlorobaculum sp.]|nr:type II restriction endonuclease [Chlorobaculum sp.]
MTHDLASWLSDFYATNWLWYAKRLSGNDTLANATHQAGPYVPKNVLFQVFPLLDNPKKENPDIRFRISIDSHEYERHARAIWYNNKLFGGTRNEARMTGFGGIDSALLDPENTGALAIFAFRLEAENDDIACRVWICRTTDEEELAESHIGVVEPGKWLLHKCNGATTLQRKEDKQLTRTDCWLAIDDIPASWLKEFPSGIEVIRKAIDLRPEFSVYPPDKRLIKRRDCEFELFKSLELAIEFPRIKGPFSSLETFLDIAQTILQRRKSRSGRSLELHLREIFIEESLREEMDFSYQRISEISKKPDFIFPSIARYRDPAFSSEKLRVLAVKTTCKDRWRQVINEANRIGKKHLFTLQEGISLNQFREMQAHDVQLVVPADIIKMYHKDIRSKIMSLEGFLSEIKTLEVNPPQGN